MAYLNKPKQDWITLTAKDWLLNTYQDKVVVTKKNNFFLLYDDEKGYWNLDMDENKINTILVNFMETHSARPLMDGDWELVDRKDEWHISLKDYVARDGWYDNIIKLFKRDLRNETKNSMVKYDSLPAHSKNAVLTVDDEKLNYILINVKNGVLHINTDTFEILRKSHQKKHFFTSRLEIDYSPLEEAPTWDSFLDQVVEDKVDKEMILMYMAYCLLSHDFRWEAALYIYGEGANGKGTLAKSFRYMFSNPTFTSISSLEKNFGLMGLIGGNFWWANESDNKTINTEDLKRMISGEPVEIDIKHAKPETHLFKMKVMITANEIPLLKKYADKRRFIVVRFPNKFEGQSKDVNLDAKLILELPGLLNLLVDQIPLYLENSARLSANISDRYEVQYEELADPFKIFMETYVTETGLSDDVATSVEITMAFNAWAIKNNHETYNATTIGRRVNAMFGKLKKKVVYVDKIVKVYTENSLEENTDIVKVRQRGFVGLELDRAEIYQINPQWNIEDVNSFHLKTKDKGEVIVEPAQKISRLQFAHKIHALCESGLSWDQAYEIGKLEGFTEDEVAQIISMLIRNNDIKANDDGMLIIPAISDVYEN